jgi:transcriptional regulator with XRE-family HTH domain
MDLGKTIQTLRKRKGYRQNTFADMVALSQTYLSQIENNQKEPNLTTLKLIAAKLDTSLPILFFLSLDEADIPASKKDLFQVLGPLVKPLIEGLADGD